MSLRVLEVSGEAAVQDLGRPGHAHEGVPAGGAADTLSLRVANRAVGNDDGAAGVEVAMGRLVLAAMSPCLVAASSGGDAFACRRLAKGESIEIVPDPGHCRAYVAVAGGIDVPPVLGSRSTLRSAGFGGLGGRGLRAGDELPVGPGDSRVEVPAQLPAHLRAMVGFALRRRVLRVVADGAEAPIPTGLLRVSGQSDRVGVRLARAGGGTPVDSGPSRGVLHGTIQSPSSGELIALGPDGPTTGGYATVGAVIAADLPALGQVLPGQWVGLEVIGRDEATDALRAREAALEWS